jgi:hypothetical protein
MLTSRHFIFLICLSVLSSCATFKKDAIAENQVGLTKENIHLINGTYASNDKTTPLPLHYFWGSYYKESEYQSVYQLVTKNHYPYYVTLKAIDNRKVQIEISVGGNILKSYVIRGRIKNGYFEQNRKTFIIPLSILNQYHSSKFRIGLLENGNVVTDFKKYDFGTYYLFILFNKNESLMNIEHQKK